MFEGVSRTFGPRSPPEGAQPSRQAQSPHALRADMDGHKRRTAWSVCACVKKRRTHPARIRCVRATMPLSVDISPRKEGDYRILYKIITRKNEDVIEITHIEPRGQAYTRKTREKRG